MSKTPRFIRLTLLAIFISCALHQLTGTFVPRPERKGWLSASLGIHELIFGMGGGYAFFTESNFWRGDSASTWLTLERADGRREIALEDWLSHLGALKARFLEYHVLWGYYESDPSHLEALADRIAAIAFKRDPTIRSVTVAHVRNELPRVGETSRILPKAWHTTTRKREP